MTQIKDEIPGISTYLFEANRFRDPWEFEGWKDSYQNALVMAGLSSTLTPHDLIHLYQEICIERDNKTDEYTIQDLKKKNNLLEKKISELDSLLIGSQTENYRLNQSYHEMKHIIETQKTDIKKIQDDLIKYGTHTNDCNYIDAISVGRIGSKDKEINLCDCEFTKKKIDILGIEVKNEKPKEIIQDDSGDLE